MEVDTKTLNEALKTIGNRAMNNESLSGKTTFSDEDCTLLYSLGYSLYHSGDLAQSETVFRKLVQNKPFEQKHWLGLAASLQLQELYREALTAWSMACLLKEEDPTPHFHSAECLLSLKEQGEAMKALNIAEARAGNNPSYNNLKIKIDALKKIWGA